MKNKKTLICLILLITSIVISCSWEVPQNVSVKTKADYEFGLGRVKYDLTDMLDVPKMLEQQGTVLPMGMKLFDYFPKGSTENYQRYLVRVPIIEYPLDIEQYLEKLDMVTKMDAINFEKELPIPEITIPSMEVPIPATDIAKSVNVAITGAGIVNTQTVDMYPSAILEQAGVSIGKAYYKKLKLVIEGQDIESLAGGSGIPLPKLPPETKAEYKFSPTIKDGRVVTIDLGDGIERKTTVKDNKAIFELENVIIDTNKAKITFDSAPEFEFVNDSSISTTGRSIGGSSSRAPAFQIPELDFSKLPMPNLDDLGPIPAIPNPEEILNDPTIAEKIPGIDPGNMSPEQIKNQIDNTKVVLVIEGYTAMVDTTETEGIPASTLTKVSGISMLDMGSSETNKPALDIPITIDPVVIEEIIPTMADVDLIRAKIGDGKINMALSGLNAGYEIRIQSTGGLSIAETTISNQNPDLVLNNLTLEKGKSTINGSAIIRLKDSEIDFENLKLVLTPELKSIAEVTADLKTQITVNEKFDLPAEIASLVKKIGLNASGVKIKYTNTLPSGNNIKFYAKSDFLNIKGNDSTDPNNKYGRCVEIKSGVVNEPAELLTPKSQVDANGQVTKSGTEITLNKDGGNAIDINVFVWLPGATQENPTYVTIKDFEFNKPYKIALELTPVLDWDSVTVDTSNLPMPEGNIDTGMNVHAMISDAVKDIDPDLTNRLSLPQLPIYIFCTKPDVNVFDSLSINAKASLQFGSIDPNDPNKITPATGSKPTYILGDESGKGSINFVNSIPKLEDGKKFIDTDFEKLNPDKNEVSVKLDLGESLSNILKTDGNLLLNYAVDITNQGSKETDVVIKKSDLVGKNSTICLEAYIDLGLAFKLDAMKNSDGTEKVDAEGNPIGMSVDLIELAGLGEQLKDDLLQGMIPQLKQNNLDEVLSLIKEVGVEYTVYDLPLALPVGKDFTVSIQLEPGIAKNVGLLHGKVNIDNQDLKTIFEDPSEKLLLKEMKVNVPAGLFSVKRNKLADVNVKVAFATDGKLQIMKDGKVIIGQNSENAGGAK